MKLIKIVFWIIIIAGAAALSYIALHYFDFDSNKGFLKAKQPMLANPLWTTIFYLHLLFGAIATIFGLPLFFPKLIDFRSRTHKLFGKIYIISILLISGPTGLYLSFYAEGGAWASIGFILMSLAWTIPTYLAFDRAIKGNIESHKKWIIRSYAMTLAGVTLRIYTPIGAQYFDYDTNFIISAYLPWILNLFIAEILVRTNNYKPYQLKTS